MHLGNCHRNLKYVISGLVIFVGAWTVLNVASGMRLYNFSDRDTYKIVGCYYVGRHKLFTLTSREIITKSQSFGAVGSHEKNLDVLVLDSPVEIQYEQNIPVLRRGGLASKLEIVYGKPVVILIFDKSNNLTMARRKMC